MRGGLLGPGSPTTSAVRALIVDDTVDDADLSVAQLESAGLTVESERVDTAEAMAGALARGPWDVVLCDHTMPGFGSKEAITILAAAGCPAPAIIVSGAIGEEAAVAAMRAGAVDFVSKDHLFRLPAAVQRALDEAAREREHRRRAEELAHARRMESIGRLAGGVAHDLNNKLAVILGFTDIVSRALGAGNPLARDLGEVRAAAEYSAALTRDLLAFGRRQTLRPEPVVAAEIAAGLQRILRPTIGETVTLVVQDASEAAVVMADRAQLEQALVSLALNAHEAMPDGGRLTIRTARVPAEEPGGHGASVAGAVTISVSDTGVGMPEEIRERVFEPFFTTKRFGGGTGLALAAVSGFVEQIGGTITVRSRPGQGTTFRIELPHYDAAPGQRSPATMIEPAGLDVLLVEDDEQVRRLLELLLADAGHRVAGAGSGDEALAILGEPSRPLDLVITDMVLPDLRGSEIVRRARQLRPGVSVLCISGYPDDPLVESETAPDGFLTKPFSGEELSAAIRSVLSAVATPDGTVAGG